MYLVLLSVEMLYPYCHFCYEHERGIRPYSEGLSVYTAFLVWSKCESLWPVKQGEFQKSCNTSEHVTRELST